MEFHETELTMMVGEEPTTFPMRIGYEQTQGFPEQRERGGLAVSPAERPNAEIHQVELQVGDKWVNMSFLIGLFSEDQAEAIITEILGE